ncbi:MAG: DUF5915 domain-containing protein, partial [Promethearchaeota archaeon]
FLNNLIQDLRSLRDQVKIKLRQPIKEFLLYFNQDDLDIIKKHENLIKSELRVKDLQYIDKKKAKSLFSEELIINKGAIGRDFKKDRLKVEKYLTSLKVDEIRKKMSKGRLKVKIDQKEYEINKDHFQIKQNAKEPFAVKLSGQNILFINSELDKELLKEGFANDFIRNMQDIRKKLGLTRGKEKLIVNVQDEFNLKDFLTQKLIDVIKEETGIKEFSSNKKGEEFIFKIHKNKIIVQVEVTNL